MIPAFCLWGTIAWENSGETDEPASVNFPSDLPIALRAMQRANGEGLINGSDGSLLPGGTTTRAQAASILMKFDQSVVGN